MAESLAEAAEEAAEGIGKIAVYVGGKIFFTISSISAKSVGDVCTTAVKLGAIYAGYKLIAKAIDGAVFRGLGGERDDQAIRDIRTGCLHVLLHCFTDQRLLEVLDDFESGRMKDRFEKEFSEIGIEVEGLKVEIDNIEDVMKRKEQILSFKRNSTESVDVNVVRKESEVAKTNKGIKDDLEQEIWKIENETEELKFEFYDAEKVRKRKEQIFSPNIHMAESIDVHVVQKETNQEAEKKKSYMIRCDYENRGCQELIKFEFLDRHVRSCGYSPTRCKNACCAEVINRHEKDRHERELCQFRKIVCDECGERVILKSSRLHPCFMQKRIDELERELNVLREVKHVKQVKLTQHEMAYLTREATERYDLFTGRKKIFVCGGNDGKTCFNSAESYSWPDNTWTLEPAMNEKRSQHSAVVHAREIYVSGGWTGPKCTDSVESLNVDEKNSEWKPQSTIPIKCNGHKMVCHENNMIQTGGRECDNVSDGIYEISLNPPHNTKLLTKMPEPRCSHGCEIIDNQVVVAGGTTSRYVNDAKNTVYAYDLNNNELKTLPPLLFAVTEMATVSYKDNVILIGGVNEKVQTLNTVVMYDVKTGKIKMLPCLNHKRAGCAAVVTGNVIVVMGGMEYDTKTCLNSVECLDLNTNVWRELSPMTTERNGPAAVLKPIS